MGYVIKKKNVNVMLILNQKDYKNFLTDKLLMKFNLINKQKFISVRFYLDFIAKSTSLHVLSVFIAFCLVRRVPNMVTPSKTRFSKKFTITTGFTNYVSVLSSWLFLVLPFFSETFIKKYKYNLHSLHNSLVISSFFFFFLKVFFEFTTFFPDRLPLSCNIIVNQNVRHKRELYNNFLLSFYKLY